MKLYLTSVASITIDKLIPTLPKSPRELRLVFIPTAANPYQNKWFVDEDRNKLKQLGFNLIEIDIAEKKQDDLKELMKNIDIIFVSGGNTFYLLDKCIASGFDQLVKDFVSEGIIYIGSSAGSVIAGPDIEPIRFLEDQDYIPDLKFTQGFGLVNFVVLPHYGNPKYEAKYQDIIEKYKDKYELITVTDYQAVLVEDSNYKIILA